MQRLSTIDVRPDRSDQAYATTAALADRIFIDELNPGGTQSIDQLHKRVDIAADDAIARFHPLDGRDRQPGEFSKLPLIDPQKSTGRPHLSRSDHGSTPSVRHVR